MKHTIQFDYELNEKVFLLDIQRPGYVEGIICDFLGVQYKIRYWDNGTLHSVWLKSFEIAEIK